LSAWTVHGGRLEASRAAWPDAPAPWLDLSTGINPNPWDVARAGPIDWHALPGEGALAVLEAAAAELFGIAADRLCAVPGTEIGLRLLATLDLPAPVHHLAPGYRTHAEVFPGSVPVARDALGGVMGTLLLANPGNPDGVAIAPADLVRPDWLIVDEAFADASPETSLLPGLAADARVIVLRSFGKYFGLAGVRLGFVAGPEDVIAMLRTRIGSWPVSAAAIAIGTAAYRDAAWIAATRASLPKRAAALDAVLRRHGLAPGGACPLFRLVETPDAGRIFETLARHAILTRPFAERPHWLRFGLPGSDAALDRLDRALASG
jgi:cobalamin biosynthetic protein CobC